MSAHQPSSRTIAAARSRHRLPARASRPRPLLALFPSPGAATPADPPPAASLTDYERFHDFTAPPFAPIADLNCVYSSAAHNRASQDMLSAIRRRDGLVLLTGPRGAGKTLLCGVLAEELDRRTLISHVAETPASIEALIGRVLVDFGMVSAAALEAGRLQHAPLHDLCATLRTFLLSLVPLDACAVVMIDDAQRLPGDVLRQIHLLLEGEADRGVLQILLAGEPALAAALGHKELRHVSDRVSVRCVLGPLLRDETEAYITMRIAAAGGSPRVTFDDSAVTRIHELSAGVPGVINRLCDRALAGAYASAAHTVNRRIVDAAARASGIRRFPRILRRRIGVLVFACLAAVVIVGAALAWFVF